MKFDTFSHRFADIILNSDIEIKDDISKAIRELDYEEIIERFERENVERTKGNKKVSKGKQSTINSMFREKLMGLGWEIEKPVFKDVENELIMDFWKRQIGVDVAFNHRSFIGGDLLRFQAAAEVKNLIKVGIYICPTKEFARLVSHDGPSMVNFERTRWYLQTLFQVITVPIWLIGLEK